MNDFDGFYSSTLLVASFFLVLLILLYRFRGSSKITKRAQVALWNISLLLCLLSFTFLVAESYYRFYVDTTDSFALNKISQRWIKRHYTLNNFTVRDNVDYRAKVAPGKRRLTIFGDSFTAGHGVQEVDDRFGNLLRKTNPNWEVHVMAYNGLNSADELDVFKKLADGGYQFDVVLLAYCINDLDYLLPEAPKIYERIYAFNEGLGFFGRNSYFVNTMLFRLFAINDPDFMNYSDFVKTGYRDETWSQQQEVLHAFNATTNNLGEKLTVVTFPFFQHRQDNYQFLEVHQTLGSFWSSVNANHLDLLPVYAPYPDEDLVVNSYDAHPNEFAHKLAAEALNNYLKLSQSH